MSNDAKLGLVIGIGLVILIAAVFFRKDPATGKEPPEPGTAAAVNAPSSLPAIAPRGRVGGTMSHGARRTEAAPAHALKHTVQEGETLVSLAKHYYQDGARFVEIYRANQAVLREPDALEPGTVLLIPDLSK